MTSALIALEWSISAPLLSQAPPTTARPFRASSHGENAVAKGMQVRWTHLST